MEITTDIILKGTDWEIALKKLSKIFSNRTNYNIFMLCLTIGIMYDKRIEKLPETGDEDSHSVPRNVIQNNDNGKMDFIFQAAVLSTLTENFSEEERLNLAFGEKTSLNKIGFLLEFANYGVTKLVEQIGESELETMENIKNFLSACVEGRNLEIDDLPDELLYGLNLNLDI